MPISYDRLWKLLIDHHMTKKELREITGLSAPTIIKLGKNESVSLEILVKICKALKCDIGDVVGMVEEQ